MPLEATEAAAGNEKLFFRRKKQFLTKYLMLGNGMVKWYNEEAAVSTAKPKEFIHFIFFSQEVCRQCIKNKA